MVGVKKFSAIAAVSMVAVSGAAASIQQHDASHAHHMLAHRALGERQPSLIKVQKRLAATIGDGLGGIIGGLGRDLGLGDLDEADYQLHNLRRGLVGDVLGAGGGQPQQGSSSSSPPPATSQPAANNGGAPSSTNAPAPAPAPAPSSTSAPASRPPSGQTGSGSSSNNNNTNASNNNNNNSAGSSNNQNRPASSASSSNNAGNNNNASGNNGANRGTGNSAAGVQAAASSAAVLPTDASSAVAAASSSAAAAAASLLSEAAASQASAEAQASLAAATMVASRSSASAAATGVNRANSTDSGGSDGTTKVVVPIVVIAASVAVIAVAWTVIRRLRKRKQEQYDPRLRPIDSEYHHRRMVGGAGLAAGGAAFAVGGAADGLVRDRPRRESLESFEAGRPMSALTEEEGEYSGMAPPMQEVAPYAAVGPASSRLRNYGSTRGGQEDLPPAHRVTDSMYIDDAMADEHGAYDVNYYDGSSSAGYNNRATRGLDAAAVNSGAGRPYSPYEEVHRAGDADYYDYDRASSSRRDPFADNKRWSG